MIIAYALSKLVRAMLYLLSTAIICTRLPLSDNVTCKKHSYILFHSFLQYRTLFLCYLTSVSIIYFYRNKNKTVVNYRRRIRVSLRSTSRTRSFHFLLNTHHLLTLDRNRTNKTVNTPDKFMSEIHEIKDIEKR